MIFHLPKWFPHLPPLIKSVLYFSLNIQIFLVYVIHIIYHYIFNIDIYIVVRQVDRTFHSLTQTAFPKLHSHVSQLVMFRDPYLDTSTGDVIFFEGTVLFELAPIHV